MKVYKAVLFSPALHVLVMFLWSDTPDSDERVVIRLQQSRRLWGPGVRNTAFFFFLLFFYNHYVLLSQIIYLDILHTSRGSWTSFKVCEFEGKRESRPVKFRKMDLKSRARLIYQLDIIGRYIQGALKIYCKRKKMLEGIYNYQRPSEV